MNKNTGIQSTITNGTLVPSPRYEQPRACGATNTGGPASDLCSGSHGPRWTRPPEGSRSRSRSRDANQLLKPKSGPLPGAPADPRCRPRRKCKEEGGMLHPSWAAIIRLPRHGWRTSPPQSWRAIATTRSWKKRWPTDRAGGRAPARLAPRPREDDEHPRR
jgi:hypothetical protein